MTFNFYKLFPPKTIGGNVFSNLSFKSIPKPKTYKFFEANNGADFVIDRLDDHPGHFVMTSQGFWVKPNDYILIQWDDGTKLYQIQEVDYFDSSYSDTWTAKLALVS